MCHPRWEMAQLSQMPQIKNEKPDFSPTFQKVELRNSTFFQLWTELFDLYERTNEAYMIKWPI